MYMCHRFVFFFIKLKFDPSFEIPLFRFSLESIELFSLRYPSGALVSMFQLCCNMRIIKLRQCHQTLIHTTWAERMQWVFLILVEF